MSVSNLSACSHASSAISPGSKAFSKMTATSVIKDVGDQALQLEQKAREMAEAARNTAEAARNTAMEVSH